MKVLIVDLSAKAGVSLGGGARVAGSLFNGLKKYGISTYYLGYKNQYIKVSKNVFILEGGKIKPQAAARKVLHKLRLNGIAESNLGRIAYYSAYSLTGVSTEGAEHWVETIKPDIILASSIQDYVVLKRMKKHLSNAKLVYIEHANASGEYRSAFDYNIIPLTFGTGTYKGLHGAQERFFSFFDGVIALNKEQAERIRRLNENVVVIHSSVLMEDVKVNPTKLKRFKEKLGISKDTKTVLYLGRLSEAQKNVSTLIIAFKAIKDDRFKLMIVGEGRSIHLYEQMSEGDGRILVQGRVPEQELPYYYSIADLYVLPSLWESFNATMIEAAHFGSGLLLSRLAINSDIIEKFGKRLYIFDPYDAGELRSKIIRYFSDANLRKKLKEVSKEISREYTKEKQIKSYADSLKNMHMHGKLQ